MLLLHFDLGCFECCFMTINMLKSLCEVNEGFCSAYLHSLLCGLLGSFEAIKYPIYRKKY